MTSRPLPPPMLAFLRSLGWRLATILALLILEGTFLIAALIQSLWIDFALAVAYEVAVLLLVAWDRLMAAMRGDAGPAEPEACEDCDCGAAVTDG